MRRRTTIIAVLLSTWMLGTTAFADDAADIKKRGDDAMESGRPADALAAYNEAYAISKDPALLYNKGRALQALTEYPQALSELEAFDKQAPADLKARVPGLPKMIAELRARVTTLTIACDVDGARVRFRDRTIGRCPVLEPVVVNAGKGTLEVTADQYMPWQRDVDLPGGGTATYDVHLLSKNTTGVLVVKSSTPSAEVTIDGKVSGTAPVETSLSAGTHTVELRRDGYKPAKTSAVVGAGEKKEIDVTLESEPGLLGRWWFWAGVGAVVAGGVAVVIALNTEKEAESGTVPPGRVVGGLSISGAGFRF